VEYEETMRAPNVKIVDRCISSVQSAADELGYESYRLLSGAGRDATHLNAVCDTGIVFVVSKDDKSHSSNEYTSWDDCYSAANTLGNAAYKLATDD
jgi:beta-ureidopropionase / N-carbamoyl-L-amino-acid hydrolase